MAGIRLGSEESARGFKGIICDGISEFESFMPSHAPVLHESVFCETVVMPRYRGRTGRHLGDAETGPSSAIGAVQLHTSGLRRLAPSRQRNDDVPMGTRLLVGTTRPLLLSLAKATSARSISSGRAGRWESNFQGQCAASRGIVDVD